MRLEIERTFLTCSALRLDCIMLKAKALEDAKAEGWRIAKGFCVRYRKELEAQSREAAKSEI